ncbi:MAG: hypothetical protein JWL93_898 [Hyphomicrobiales bacterium]|nr:hypothetical protein [Hyphomicrobiales bacterium]
MPLTKRTMSWNPAPAVLGGLWLLACVFWVESFERTIAQDAQAILATASDAVDGAAVTVAGRDIHLSGIQFTQSAGDRLINDLSHVRGVAIVISKLQPLAPPAGALTFSAVSSGAGMILSGHVPDPAIRAELVQAARAACDGQVVDEMVYAAGAQPTFRAAALYGIAQAARLDGGRHMLMNMVYSLSGRADEASAYEDVVAAMKMAPTGIAPANIAIEPPEPGGPAWNVKRVGGRLEMSGWLAADGERVGLVAAARAKFTGQVEDRLRSSRSSAAREGVQLIRAALEVLEAFVDGEVDMRRGIFSVTGVLPAGAAVNEARMAAETHVPSPWRLGSFSATETEVRPYRFQADKSASAFRLSGFVPESGQREVLVARLKRLAPHLDVLDETRPGKGAPAGFNEAMGRLLAGLARLSEGRAVIEDQVASLRGEAQHAKAASAVVRDLQSSLPDGFRFDATVSTPDALLPLNQPECESEVQARLRHGPLLFSSGKAELDGDSLSLLDGLVAALLRCRDAEVRIGGHTDESGAADANLELSRRRAEAVLEHFRSQGVLMAQMSAEGFGATRPLASNETEAGRALNRRIDIHVSPRP